MLLLHLIVIKFRKFFFAFRHLLLRLLSFGLELTDSDGDLEKNQAIEFLQYLDFVFYPPLYLAGPFFEFKNFTHWKYRQSSKQERRPCHGTTSKASDYLNQIISTAREVFSRVWKVVSCIHKSEYFWRVCTLAIVIVVSDASLHTFYSPNIYLSINFQTSAISKPNSSFGGTLFRWFEIIRSAFNRRVENRHSMPRENLNSYYREDYDQDFQFSRNPSSFDKAFVMLVWYVKPS